MSVKSYNLNTSIFKNGLSRIGKNIKESLVGKDYGLLTNPSGAWDRFKNGETNVVNKQIADQNLAFQQENLDYQKALQQQIFQREDSAYQRTAADMRAAGISPLMMNGTNGAGEAIQTEAPQNGYQHSDKGFGDILSYGSQIANSIANYKSQAANVDFVQAQTEAQKISNNFTPFSLGLGIVGQILQNQSLSKSIKQQTADYGLTMLKTLEQSYKNSDLKRWNTFAKGFGFSSNMTRDDRLLSLGKAIVDDNSNGKGKVGKMEEVLKDFTDYQNEKGGMADGLYNIMPKSMQSWFDSLADKLHEFGQSVEDSGYPDKLRDNYKNHGWKLWRWK